MPVYSVTFAAVAVSAAQDLFEVVSPAAGVIFIHGYELFQTSDFGDAQSEGLPLQWIRGYTTTGSGGTSVTPVPASTRDTAGSAAATCEANNTTVATGGSPTTYAAGGWNVQGGADKFWPPELRPVLRNSERGVLRMGAPTDPVTLYGTLYFEEL